MNDEAKHIVLCVTNDLTADKRMHRTAQSLVDLGAKVTLIGRQRPQSSPLPARSFSMRRLRCHFQSGPMFYLEYNLRLFWALWNTPTPDTITACDPDTLPAVLLLRFVRAFSLVYDSHELFSEVPELRKHPFKKRIWSRVQALGVKHSDQRYTVNPTLAKYLERQYGRPFHIVYNYPISLECSQEKRTPHTPLRLFYQGVLNEGRGLKPLVRSMKDIPDAVLYLFGEGVMASKLLDIIEELELHDRVLMRGLIPPEQLYVDMLDMDISFNLLEQHSLNYYYSTANKFYDAIQCHLPQITMDFPEYRRHFNDFHVGILLSELSPKAICEAVQCLRTPKQYQRARQACIRAAQHWTWPHNHPTLRELYGFDV